MATTTATLTVTVATTVSAITSSASAASTVRATPQGGIFEGVWPNTYNMSNPIILFIIQAGIIIILCRLLHYPLSLLRQPRVIAEVIGGILLGPSVFMRIPGFQDAIFPTASMPILNNVANLGLILFLFLIALEVDLRLFTVNWRNAVSVGFAGMIVPFGLGWGIAWGLFNAYHNEPGTVPISFGVYGLFIGTALAITAFPVLCRILSELNLLSTPVGVTVLAAGVGNDVIGWILLALCVALVNNSSGLAALWVLLVCIGWVLFMTFAVRPVFYRILKRTGSLENGPSEGIVALTILLVLTSSFFTGIIGVHPIFGAFLAGLICPHERGFAIKLTEKIEDLVSALMLPLYFANSGLSTNLGLLNDGTAWGYTVGVIAVAFFGKIVGGTLAAKSMKLVWRESLTIGVLMSCKGLVELIVLNIGLQAKILSQKTFTIFVVMALVTTVATTPLTSALYPLWYQKKLEQWKRGEIDWDGKPTANDETSASGSIQQQVQGAKIRRLLVHLRLDSLPGVFTLMTLLGQEQVVPSQPENAEQDKPTPAIGKKHLEVHALRTLELTDRTSSVMRVTEGEDYSTRDPVVNAFRTFAQLQDIATSSSVVIAPEASFAQIVVSQAADQESNFALIPWSEVGSNTDDQAVPVEVSRDDRFTGKLHLEFIQATLAKAECKIGIFINNGLGGGPSPARPRLARTISGISMRSLRETARPPSDKSHHIFLPFIGGPDDVTALHFVMQLAQNPHITATIARLTWGDDEGDVALAAGGALELKNAINTEISAADTTLLSTLKTSMPAELQARITFTEISVTNASVLEKTVKLAQETVGRSPRNSGDIIVVGRSQSKLPIGPKNIEQNSVEYDMAKTIGKLGEKMARSGLKASVLVIQAHSQAREHVA